MGKTKCCSCIRKILNPERFSAKGLDAFDIDLVHWKCINVGERKDPSQKNAQDIIP